MKNELDLFGPVPDLTKRSKSDINYSIEPVRWFLTPIGIWPLATNIWEKILSEILVIVCYFLIFFLFIPCGLHFCLNEKDPRKKMKMIGPMSFCLMAISKYSFLVMRKNKIRDCLNHIQTDWRRVQLPTERDIMITNAKEGRYIANLSAIFMYGGGFFYRTIMPLTAGSVVTPNNITIRPLTSPVYAPLFAAQKTPSYEIVFTIQWFSGFVLYSITIGAISLAAIFVLHACGQLKVVTSQLDNLIDGTNEKFTDMFENRIAKIVQLHLRAFNFIVSTEKILTEICLIEFCGCTMEICFVGYYCMTEFEKAETIATVTYCVLLTSFTYNIFILCYIGETLTQQGIKVGLTAYMINWYELSGKKAKDLILILAISKYPKSITAGSMAKLSYNSFCGVIKSAMAYLNLLRTAIL